MVREPFWLGLITVMVVMIVIGVGYLVKKHLPEKIEKLLRTEMESNGLSGGGGGGGYDSNTFSGDPLHTENTNSHEMKKVHPDQKLKIFSIDMKYGLHYSLLLKCQLQFSV